MITIADVHSSRASAGISMRSWLYLGFAVLGFSLMSLDEPQGERLAVPAADQPARIETAATPAVDALSVAKPSRTARLEAGSVVLR
jgi:hypothetical protein